MFVARRMREESINCDISLSTLPVDFELMATFSDTNGDIQKIDLGTTYFTSELNIRVKKFM